MSIAYPAPSSGVLKVVGPTNITFNASNPASQKFRIDMGQMKGVDDGVAPFKLPNGAVVKRISFTIEATTTGLLMYQTWSVKMGHFGTFKILAFGTPSPDVLDHVRYTFVMGSGFTPTPAAYFSGAPTQFHASMQMRDYAAATTALGGDSQNIFGEWEIDFSTTLTGRGGKNQIFNWGILIEYDYTMNSLLCEDVRAEGPGALVGSRKALLDALCGQGRGWACGDGGVRCCCCPTNGSCNVNVPAHGRV